MAQRLNKIQRLPPANNGVELENHIILRLPEPQAQLLKEAVRAGDNNIKDRLSVQFDFTNDKDDMRNATVTFDTIMYRARLVDIPSISETWKTIDGKNFYKTADVCQMLMFREEEDPPEEEPTTSKRRDPLKIDKKYLWPHGITPPLKNVRKKRFRKTLKKKNLELPEIEKEVKRLLRTDNEAVSIKWEVVKEEEEKQRNNQDVLDPSNFDKELFGEALSSSEDEVGPAINIMDEDDDSRLSVDDSRASQSYMDGVNSPNGKSGPTEFSPGMFNDSPVKSEGSLTPKSRGKYRGRSPRGGGEASPSGPSLNKLYAQLSTHETDLQALLAQRTAHEQEIGKIENFALKQRFLGIWMEEFLYPFSPVEMAGQNVQASCPF